MRRRPWFTLLACLVAAGAVRAQDAALTDAVATQPAAPVAPPESGSAGTGLNWRGAPISTSGSVSYDLRATHGRDEASTLEQLVTGELSARSYIYQPWFATVSGTLRFTEGRSRTGSGGNAAEDPLAALGPLNSRDRFLSGNARVDLFPRSRFPFEVHVERGDSRIDSALASTLDFATQSFGFSQRYRPQSGTYSLSASFDHREQVSTGVRDRQDLLAGDFATQWKNHELSLGISASRAAREATDERTSFRTLVARHQYSPASPLSINTTVNWSETDEQLAGGPSDVSALQWSSVGLWHREGSRLTLTGSVLGLLLREKVTNRALDNIGFTLGGTYELNKNARLTATGGATFTDSNGNAVRGFNGSVGASWQGDTREIGPLRYDWFANGNAGGATATGGNNAGGLGLDTSSAASAITPFGSETQTNLGAQLGHTLSRSWPLTAQSGLVLNAGQTLALSRSHSSRSEPGDLPASSRTLLQMIGATWNANGDNRSGYARAAYSDSLELGGTRARFQLFNFQLSGNFNFDRNRSLTGDLTWQHVSQRAGDLRDSAAAPLILGLRTGSTSASGEITYRQQRLFGIAQLRFTSRLKLAQDVLNQPGTFATIPDRETRLWENRLDWLVGRLETQLVLRISDVDRRRREFLMWRVQRNFGD